MVVLVVTVRWAIELFENLGSKRFAWRAHTNALPVQTQDLRGITIYKTQIMGDCDDCQFVLIVQTMNEFVDVFFTRFIDAGSWFIEQENIRVANKRKSNQTPLKLAP
jgi:hypothetical protein